MNKVTVIITSYERPENLTDKVLERAIISVINQTFTDIELLIVIDGFSRHLNSAINDISKKYNFPIKVLSSGEKVGAASTRNIGIDNSKGEFIAFLDDDDEWKSDKIYKQLLYYTNCDVPGILFSNAQIENENITIRKYRGERIASYLFVPNKRKQIGFVQTSTLFFSKEITKKVKFTENLERHQDWDFVIKADALGIRFYQMEDILIIYHNDLPVSGRLGLGKNGVGFQFSEQWLSDREAMLNREEQISFQKYIILPQVIRSSEYLLIDKINKIHRVLNKEPFNVQKIKLYLKYLFQSIIIEVKKNVGY
ncbi:glycosyltransferase family 2 protein [Enterococcus casseliflavus]|uniref:glycosyltransferase family 2 protein n=1 Tax=Enterococcus casseliflavus TaxID=37734 RepID=UPI00177D2626|nr:glycosyltransferase family 2 protein [Enterococcus casseliflavus]QOG30495.1 glycosyltransferase family 2 protein [Enterococcus casseliflavus]